MSRSSIPLDMIQVASPCHVSWDSMEGNQTVRFCSTCENHVYNLSQMNRRQAERLVERTEGRLCVRFYRRQDGTVMSRDCPLSVRKFRRWVAVLVSTAAVLLLAMVGFTLSLFGMTGTNQNSHSGRSGGSSKGSSSGTISMPRWVQEWLKPEPDDVIMGDMCPPEPVTGKMVMPEDMKKAE